MSNRDSAVRVHVTRYKQPEQGVPATEHQESEMEQQSDEESVDCSTQPQKLFAYEGDYYRGGQNWSIHHDEVEHSCYDKDRRKVVAHFSVGDGDHPTLQLLGPEKAYPHGSPVSESCLTSLIGNGYKNPLV
ncbi:MAG: hypothetical protein Cons2KO_30440 [Congregibacter sp.]